MGRGVVGGWVGGWECLCMVSRSHTVLTSDHALALVSTCSVYENRSYGSSSFPCLTRTLEISKREFYSFFFQNSFCVFKFKGR